MKTKTSVMNNTIENRVILLADSHHGVYIPQFTVKDHLNHPAWDWSEVSQDDVQAVLAGPDGDWYWEAWENIMGTVIVTDDQGTRYNIMYNEDLWLVPTDINESEVEQWII